MGKLRRLGYWSYIGRIRSGMVQEVLDQIDNVMDSDELSSLGILQGYYTLTNCKGFTHKAIQKPYTKRQTELNREIMNYLSIYSQSNFESIRQYEGCRTRITAKLRFLVKEYWGEFSLQGERK